jgi:PAS domain S-box-containing protein/putative nucleotidyltransferase with HDIG domain
MSNKIKYNILCVDDNQNNLFTLDALLSTQKDIIIHEALGAQKALDILLKEHIDLILCDVQMPDINGFELAQMVKSNKKTKDIPIIFITAVFKSEEFIQQGYQIGAIDYLTKPIDDNQLLNKISMYLKVFEQTNKLLQSEKRFYDIAQSVGDGIYTMDRDYNTTFINQAGLSMLGFSERELLGKNIHNFIHYKTIQNKPISSKQCKIHGVLDDEEIHRSNDDYFIKKDGSFLPVSYIATPLYVDHKLVGSVTIFRDKSTFHKIDALEFEKLKNSEQIIHSMVNMIESRDSYTAGHTKRVANYCELIATQMEYSNEEIELLKNAAWLHDIGKISTPDGVLLKPDKLDNVEYELIKDHLSAGYEMLKEIDQYKEIADIIREHHERYDGKGYPRGLKGAQINPLSRIMIVADAFDAMTTNRIYKPRKTVAESLKELRSLSAQQFHPEVVEATLIALKDITIDEQIFQKPKSAIEEQRFAYFYQDKLTGLYLKEYLPLALQRFAKSPQVYHYDVKLHNFSQYNNAHSWSKGDEFLISFASFLHNSFSKATVFRIEGDDFMLICEQKIEDIEHTIASFALFKGSKVTFSVNERVER